MLKQPHPLFRHPLIAKRCAGDKVDPNATGVTPNGILEKPTWGSYFVENIS